MRNLKRALSLAVASVMLLGMMVVGTSADFSDVAAEHNEEAIAVMEAAGIMIGSDGKFNPDQKVTRNEAAVVISNLLGLNAADYAGTSPFTDVPAWAEAYVAAVYANDITAGISATEFGGNNEVTTAQFSLWLMKALGYFQYQADFGDDWQMATVKQASKIELADGVSAAANAALTRNDVAKMVLNALQKDVVDFSGTIGSDITTSDGTTIKIGYRSEYDARFSTSYDYNLDDLANNTQQLAEKLFKDDLVKSTVFDAFGRPATKWEFDLDEVGTFSKTAKKIYVGGVKEKDLYKDFNLADAYDDFDLVVDGATIVDKTISSSASTKIGAAGQVVEVFFDKDVATKRVISVITYFVDEVENVTKNSDDERVIVLDSGKQFKTELFAEDDVVVFTKDTNAAANEQIKSVALAEKKTGKIEKIVGGTDLYIDGVKFVKSSVYSLDVAAGDEVDFWVDANNYVVAADPVKDTFNAADYALVTSTGGQVKGTYWVELLFADGTKKIVDTYKDYSSDVNSDTSITEALALGQIVTAKLQDNGTYKLDWVANAEAGNTASVIAGKPGVDDDNTVNEYDVVLTDSKTVYVYAINDGTDVDYKVYTGYKAAPGFYADNSTKGAATISAYIETNKTAASLVFVQILDDALNTTAADVTVIAFDADIKAVEIKDVATYYEYASVVDGKIDTIKVVASDWATLNSNFATKTTIVASVDVDSDGIATIGSQAAAVQAAATEIAFSNEVLTIDSAALAYEDDVQVYLVDTDGVITAIELDDIDKDDHSDGKDPYDHITFTLDSNSNKVDLIVLQLNP